MYVLDSSALIELINEYPRKEKILSFMKDAPLITTSISMHEVLAGVLSEKEYFLVNSLFRGIRILDHTSDDARSGAEIERELSRAGTKINRFDVLIAGICKSHGAHLVTLDTDFSKIKGLTVTIIK